MATQLQIRRGTTAQMNAFTGAEGELAVNTTTDTVHVHDGSTAGGFALAKADGSNIGTYAGSFTTLAASGASTLTGAVGINIAPTSYKLTVNSGATTATTAAAIGYNGDAGTNLYINTDHGNNLVSLYASGDVSKEMRFLSGTLEVMRLDTTGSVGIGTSSPSKKFVVSEGGAHGFEISPFDGSQNATRLINYNRNTNEYFPLEIEASQIQFETAGTERMRIDGATGGVGIGTSSPARVLEVASGDAAIVRIRATDTTPGYAVTEYLNGNGGYAYAGSEGSSPGQLFIGSAASATVLGNTFAAPIQFATNNNVRATIDSSGNLLLGTTAAISLGKTSVLFDGTNQNGIILKTTRALNGSAFAGFINSSGTVIGSISQDSSSTVNYIASSDQRLKENITDSDDSGNVIDAIQVRKFDWIAGGEHEKYGFIAQELKTVVPNAVSGMGMPDEEDPMLGVDPSKLMALAIKEIQMLRARVAELENN